MLRYIGHSIIANTQRIEELWKVHGQYEQRQGTANVSLPKTNSDYRWIFHCRAVLMRGSRRVLPRDFIVIRRSIPPSRAWSRETSESLACTPTCQPQSGITIPGLPGKRQLSASAFARLHERMSDHSLRYTYESEATLPNWTFIHCQLYLMFFLSWTRDSWKLFK